MHLFGPEPTKYAFFCGQMIHALVNMLTKRPNTGPDQWPAHAGLPHYGLQKFDIRTWAHLSIDAFRSTTKKSGQAMIQSLKEDSARWDTERRSRTAGTKKIPRTSGAMSAHQGAKSNSSSQVPRVVLVDNRVLRTRFLNHPILKVLVVILMKLFFPDTLEAMLLDTAAAAAVSKPTSSSMTTGSRLEAMPLANTPKDSKPFHPRAKEEIGMPRSPLRAVLTPVKHMAMYSSPRLGLHMSMSARTPALQKAPVIAVTPLQAHRTKQAHTHHKDRTPGITKANLRVMLNQWILYTAVETSIRQPARQSTALPLNRFTSMNTPSTRLQAKPHHKTPVRPPPPPSVHRLKQDTVDHRRATIVIATIARAALDTVGDRINLTTR